MDCESSTCRTVRLRLPLPPEPHRRRTRRRDATDARLLVDRSAGGARTHAHFAEFASAAAARGRCWCSTTRESFPARLHGAKPTGGAVEFLLTRRGWPSTSRRRTERTRTWEGLARGLGRMKPGPRLICRWRRRGRRWSSARTRGACCCASRGSAEPSLLAVLDDDRRGAAAAVHRGRAQRGARTAAPGVDDRERYQTVYATQPGAVAAPTAGLHFTPRAARGAGARGPRDRAPHAARRPGDLPARGGRGSARAPAWTPSATRSRDDDGATRSRGARAEGGRWSPSGPRWCARWRRRRARTAARCARARGATRAVHPARAPASRSSTDLITNFHLPRSTLLMLVAAFAGRERVLAAYREAVERGYRFYSYGDAMLITGQGRRVSAAVTVFEVVARDGRARARRARRPRTARSRRRSSCRSGRRPRVKALSSGDRRAPGRADHPRQHLSPGAAAGRRARARARRPAPASWRWPRRDAHRLGRLPGLQPARAAHDRRGRRHLSLAPRRLPSSGSRPSARWQIQAALGSDIAMAFDECPPSDAPRERGRRGDGAHHALGAPLRGARRARPASCASASCRAARDVDAAPRAPGRDRRAAFDGLALGGLGVGEPPDGHARAWSSAIAPRDAGRPPALPDGRRARPRTCWPAIARRHRHVRLRDADPQRAQRPALHRGRARLNIANAAAPRRSAPGRGGLPMRVLRVVQPRLPLASLPRQGAALLSPGDGPQPAALPGPGAARARGHHCRWRHRHRSW